MTTVLAVARAFQEATDHPALKDADLLIKAIRVVALHETAVTIIANSLRDRGLAGNAARDRNLETLRIVAAEYKSECRDALLWAIDQLTPPEPANH